MGYRVAVVGATGNVGREMLQTLSERSFPVDEVVALASQRSAGGEVSFGEDEVLKVQRLDTFNFKGIDIVLSSAGAKVSAEFAPRAAAAGAVIIDNTSYFRMDPDVPLVVPEVNPQAIAGYKKSNIIANPNCSTIQMVVALKPLHDVAPIKRMVVATYQSVSGARQGGDGRAVQPDSRHLRERSRSSAPSSPSRSPSTCIPAHRRLHGRRLHQGRMEDGGRDQEDPRPQDQGDGDLRARAGVRRPCRGDQHRVRAPAVRRRGARDPASPRPASP